jgi:hypothetical protein
MDVSAPAADFLVGSGVGGGVTGKDVSVACSGGSVGACSGVAAVGRHSGVNAASSVKSTSPFSSALQPAALPLSSRISSSRTWITSSKLSHEAGLAATKKITQNSKTNTDEYNYHNSGHYSSSCLLFKNKRFWILSASSGGTYSDKPNSKSFSLSPEI